MKNTIKTFFLILNLCFALGHFAPTENIFPSTTYTNQATDNDWYYNF